MMEVSGFGKVIGVVDDMRACGIIDRYAVGGAFAVTLFDEPISTVDVDIFFILEHPPEGSALLSLHEIYYYMKLHGYSFDHEYINIHGWLIQFVEASHSPMWSEAIDNAATVECGDFRVRVITPNYLVLMWLLAGRLKDYSKISIFLDNGMAKREEFLAIADRHGLRSLWENEKHRFGDR